MTRQLLCICLLVATLTPIQASAFSPDDFKPISTNTCEQVTYSMCSNPQTTPPLYCSPQRYAARCESLIQEEAQRRVQQQQAQGVIVPTTHADRRVDTLQVRDVLEEEPEVVAGQKPPQLNQLMTYQAQQNASSRRLRGCDDYVQQGGHNYFAFEVMAGYFGNRFDLLFDYAYNSKYRNDGAMGFRGVTRPENQINASIGGAYLPEFQARRIGDEFGFRAKNDFFATDFSALAELGNRRPLIAAKLTSGTFYHQVDNFFDFHFLASFELRDHDPEALAFFKAKRELFRQLLKNRSQVAGQLNRQLTSTERAQWEGQLATIDDALEMAWVEADQLGCLDDTWPNRFHPCDWSHKDFYDEVRSAYGSAHTSQSNACIDATGDDFQKLPPHYALRKLKNQEFEPYVITQLDRLASETNFAQYLRDRQAVNQWAKEKSQGPAETRPKFGESFSQTYAFGDSFFGASWSSQSAWRVARGKNACNTELFASTSFDAQATIFGIQTQLLDVHASLGTKDDAQMTVYVLGMSAPKQGTRKSTFVPGYDYNIVLEDNDALEERRDIVSYDETFVIAGFPISVGAGVTGRVGVRGQGVARGQGDVQCQNGVERRLQGQYEPYASLKAFAEGSAGVTGLRVGAGAELDLLLITQPLSFDMSALSPDAFTDTTQITINNKGTQDISAMNGRLYGFVEYPTGVDVSFDGVRITYSRSKKTFGAYDGFGDTSDTVKTEFSAPIGVIDTVCQQAGYSCE